MAAISKRLLVIVFCSLGLVLSQGPDCHSAVFHEDFESGQNWPANNIEQTTTQLIGDFYYGWYGGGSGGTWSRSTVQKHSGSYSWRATLPVNPESAPVPYVKYTSGVAGHVAMPEGKAGFWFYIPEGCDPGGWLKFMNLRWSTLMETVLPFTNQTADFTVGGSGSATIPETVTGAVSGATGEVVAQVDNGTSGTLYLGNCTGTFNASEAITGSLGGAATTNGAPTNQAAPYGRIATGGGLMLWKHAQDGEIHITHVFSQGISLPIGSPLNLKYQRVHLCKGPTDSHYVNVTTNTWHHIELYWKCTGNSPTGKYKLWYDGEPAYFSYGAYQDDEGDGSVLQVDIDNMNWLADKLTIVNFLLNGPVPVGTGSQYIYFDDIYVSDDFQSPDPPTHVQAQ